MRAVIFILCAVILNNCAAVAALPPIVSYISSGATVVSYLTTEKGTSDHVLSAIADKDCALHRAVTKGEVCSEETYHLALSKNAVTAKKAVKQYLNRPVSAHSAFDEYQRMAELGT